MTVRETGLRYNAPMGLWEMWAFGFRIATITNEAATRVWYASRTDLLEPWRAASAIEGPHLDTACALVCIDGGRYAETAEWDWVQAPTSWEVVQYVRAAPVSFEREHREPCRGFATMEARFMHGHFTVSEGGGFDIHVALAPEIRTVYWHP